MGLSLQVMDTTTMDFRLVVKVDGKRTIHENSMHRVLLCSWEMSVSEQLPQVQNLPSNNSMMHGIQGFVSIIQDQRIVIKSYRIYHRMFSLLLRIIYIHQVSY